KKFEIDELRCIFCGMCEEACPVDAIELTPLYDVVGLSRQEMVFDKEKLLKVYDETISKKPAEGRAPFATLQARCAMQQARRGGRCAGRAPFGGGGSGGCPRTAKRRPHGAGRLCVRVQVGRADPRRRRAAARAPRPSTAAAEG